MVQITQATPKDIPALLAMIRKLCAYHGDTCRLGLADAQAQLIEGPLVALMARLSHQTVGYAVLEPHWRPMDDGPLFDIAHLYVEEASRGRGVGAALIASARTQARDLGASRLVIGTSPVNPGAAAAYRAMGLTEITKAPGPRFEIAL